ncbi:MAG: hypothetical protein JOZ80_03935 [Acidobacteriaceae bacterium]|nr:hypothetical protein [Acidobacteriaceae bacterium]
MGRGACVVFLTFLLVGCGNSRSQPPVGFINNTKHSDADLGKIWSAAQNSLAAAIDLNPLQSGADSSSDILPGDPRTLSVQPHQLRVSPESDISSAALVAASGVFRANPTGLIPCPQNCKVRYTTAYSLYQPGAISYAASWESSENNFRDILQYEFENQILFALGYDVSWR